MEKNGEFNLFEDLESCELVINDFYKDQTTPYAKANLCGKCTFYSTEDLISTSIRCSLKLRPKVQFDQEKQKSIASCEQFKEYRRSKNN